MIEPVHIGFIGCGGMASAHMNELLNLDGASIKAVCDVVEPAATAAAQRTGAAAYTDLDKMLQRDDLHAVYLCLPVFAHGDAELAVIRRGLPFFVEKPVARSMPVARRVLAAVRRKKLLTCVGYQLRYGGGTVAARQWLEGRTLALVVGRYWCGTGRALKGWQIEYARSGGQILEQATHTLDMMRYLCGEVSDVSALSASRELRDIDCPDVHAVMLNFQSGCIGSMTTTWAYDMDDWSHANILHIAYEDKLVRWTADQSNLSGGGAEPQPLSQGGANIDQVFVDAVRTGDGSAILSDYADAVKSLDLSLAISRSAQTNRKVRLGVAVSRST